MKRVYVNEEWCLGCHLCEYNCAYANSGGAGASDGAEDSGGNRAAGTEASGGKMAGAEPSIFGMVRALKGKEIYPRVRVEEAAGGNRITYAVGCRHCEDPICVKSCISGALARNGDGVVTIDKEKCVDCFTCMLVCPYGAIVTERKAGPHGTTSVIQKCELCARNGREVPACVVGCPNRALVYEER